MFTTTIAAISTPSGTGGIGIVRLSGPGAIRVAEEIFRPRGKKSLAKARGYTGMLGRVHDGETDLDDCIAFVFRAPKSYTGEDVVELSCHGGGWILQRVLRLCLANGAVSAGPGEFTRRAFLSGKMNLAEAEAVMDLISARGESARKAALSARDGRLSKETAKIAAALLAESAHLAAWADYPEEDLEPVDEVTLARKLRQTEGEIDALLATWDRGKLLREGVDAVIAGRPNVGKSALMNLLAGENRSIVTDIPGTTRDVVEDSVRLGDILLRLSDTAGIRDTSDPVEQIGVSRARDRIESAGLILAVFDRSIPLEEADRELLALLKGKNCVAVVNKSDLPAQLELAEVRAAIPRVVEISALNGEGREELEQAVQEMLALDHFDPAEAVVANERQRACLLEAAQSVAEAATALESGMTLDAVNVSIDSALDALLRLTGERVTDAVVDEVFARFCVGK
jgi:tRNA modification GTPase